MEITHEEVCRKCHMLASQEKQQTLIKVTSQIDDFAGAGESRWMMSLELKWKDSKKTFHCLAPCEYNEYCGSAKLHRYIHEQNKKKSPEPKRKLHINID